MTFQKLSYLIPLTNLQDRNYYLHFTDNETEAQRSYLPNLHLLNAYISIKSYIGYQDSNLGTPNLELSH